MTTEQTGSDAKSFNIGSRVFKIKDWARKKKRNVNRMGGAAEMQILYRIYIYIYIVLYTIYISSVILKMLDKR